MSCAPTLARAALHHSEHKWCTVCAANLLVGVMVRATVGGGGKGRRLFAGIVINSSFSPTLPTVHLKLQELLQLFPSGFLLFFLCVVTLMKASPNSLKIFFVGGRQSKF